jgi:uncharacterized protein YqjF (DUF2071 family)
MDHDFDISVLNQVAHRPWPLADGPWLMTQTWHDLLFAHWRIEENQIRDRVPPSFAIDRFDGCAWLGVVPFRMTNVAPRGMPKLPGLSEFPELNVRTYVRVGDRAGVYFFSLDASSRLAVRAARTLLNLPYFAAAMTVTAEDGAVRYQSDRDDGAASFEATYAPAGPPYRATPGTLEYFLAERYCLYNVDRRGRPYALDIHHPPWDLQPATAQIRRNTMAEASGVTLPRTAPVLHFSRRQDTVAWGPSPLRAT